MSVARVISIGVVVWVTFYLLVYVMFVSPTPKENFATENLTPNRNARNLKNTPFEKPVVLDPIIISRHRAPDTEYNILDTDPFVSTQCMATIFSVQQQNSVAVIVIARNEQKSLLLKTVKHFLNFFFNSAFMLFLLVYNRSHQLSEIQMVCSAKSLLWMIIQPI